ncbi:MAG TPA: hypothetical protein VL984_15495 [Acidimicrobiales bacterium]|nr:hypothetical protein [Acidimicrobiales bacterium]
MAEPSPAGRDAPEPDYLQLARELTARLATREVGPYDADNALAAVRDVLSVDADAPVASAQLEGRLFKPVVKRLVSWYMGYLAEQVNDLGFALLQLGEVLAARAERSDTTSAAIVSRLATLEERLRRLEDATPRAQEGPGHEA